MMAFNVARRNALRLVRLPAADGRAVEGFEMEGHRFEGFYQSTVE